MTKTRDSKIHPNTTLAHEVNNRLLEANIDFCIFSGYHASLIGGHRITTDIDFWADNKKWDELIDTFPEAQISDRRSTWQPGQPYDGVLVTLGQFQEVSIMAGTIIYADGVTYPSTFTDLVRTHRNWITHGGLTSWFANPVDTLLFKAISQRSKATGKKDIEDIIAIRDNISLNIPYLLARIKECAAQERTIPLLMQLGILNEKDLQCL